MAINIPIITEFSDQGLKSAQGAFKNFRNEIANAEGALGKFKAGTGAAFDAVKANAGAFAIAGGAALVTFGAKAISAASDFEESTAKIGEIFGDAAESVFDFADDAAQALGQSKQSVLDAAGTFGTFGKAAGLAGEDLSTFSNDFTGLASDLASFNNTSPEEAVQALGAALRGESEPLRRYGILLDDASMRQKALELGIVSTTKNALTPQQKILAAQALIFEQSSDAQGDFARTSDGLANQQRILKAELSNVTIEIGQKLLPVATQFAQFANDNLIPIVLEGAKAFGAFSDAVGNSAAQAEKLPGPLQNSGKQAFFFIDIAGQLLRKLGVVSDEFGRNADQIKKTQLSTDELYRAWKNGARQLIIATEKTEDLTDALKDSDEALMELKGNVNNRREWDNLIDAIDDAKEAAIEAFFQATPEALRASQRELDDARLKVAEYVSGLDTIPDDKKTDIIAALDRANLAEIEKIFDELSRDRTMTVRVRTVGGVPVGPGETPSEVRPPSSAPSPSPARPLPSVNIPGLGTFTPTPSVKIPAIGAYSAPVTVNVAGSVISQNDLVESVRKGLVNAQRNGAGLVYSNK